MNATFETLGHLGPVFTAGLVAWIASTLAYGATALKKGGAWLGKLAPVLFFLGLAATTGLLAERWIDAGRPPFKSLYESLLLFAFCTALLHLAVERYYRIAWLGAASGLMLASVYGYAILRADADIVNLPAALQSVWFVPHVVVYFFAYAALFFGFAAAVLHLWKPKAKLEVRSGKGGTVTMTYAGFMHLSNLFGFGLLTAGLVMGSIWAKAAWGDWWVWDPKENWALVSWLVYALYLHLRKMPSFSERTGALLTIAGYAAVGFTYLGMHLLPTAAQSAHVYQ